jgi:hypothetical protein
MKRIAFVSVLVLAGLARGSAAQQPSADGPYKVLMRERVGGEGGTDYIHANSADRRLYITRNAVRAIAATDSTPAREAVPGRVTVFDLETLKPLGTILNGGGNGAVVDAKTNHGFASSHPNLTMFDTKTMEMIKSIDPNVGNPPPNTQFSADGIYFDPSDDRVYIGSHPTKDLIVLDSKDGTVLGKIDLGGIPEQTISDGKGTLYAVLQDSAGSVAVVDQKTMKTTAHYPFGDVGRCNGLALDVKNGILFAACALGRSPGQPPQPVMIILRASDGKIITTLPLAGPLRWRGVQSADDGSVQLAQQRHAHGREGEQPDEFCRRAEPPDHEWRADALDGHQNGTDLRDERGAWTGTATPGGRRARGSRPQ